MAFGKTTMRFVLAALLFSTTSLAQSTPSDSLDLSSLKVEKVVTLTSTPEKAEVYALAPNGQKTLLCKATPCKRNLEVKDYSLVFVHEGFEAERRTLRLAKNTQLHAVFESPYAQIRFSVTPKNSRISLNGKPPESSSQKFILPPGAHIAQITDSCTESAVIRFKVKNGDNKEIKIKGTPTLAGLQISAIDSQNNAIEAELFIDGVLIGAVPGVHKVPACAKSLEIRKGNQRYQEQPCFKKNKLYKKNAKLILQSATQKHQSKQAKKDLEMAIKAGLVGQQGIGCAENGKNFHAAESNSGLGGGSGTRGRGGGSSGFGKKQKGPSISGRIGGNPIIMGALDKSLIDRVIKRHMNQIKYCYQKKLNANPTLGGKITVKFVITGDGTVSSAKTAKSTLSGKGASSVNNCINQRFLDFQFPEPKGGGMVIVRYPFIFQPQ